MTACYNKKITLANSTEAAQIHAKERAKSMQIPDPKVYSLIINDNGKSCFCIGQGWGIASYGFPFSCQK